MITIGWSAVILKLWSPCIATVDCISSPYSTNLGDSWFSIHHSNFLEAWILAEEHLQHHCSGVMRKILEKQYVIRRSWLLRYRRFSTCSHIWYMRELQDFDELDEVGKRLEEDFNIYITSTYMQRIKQIHLLHFVTQLWFHY